MTSLRNSSGFRTPGPHAAAIPGALALAVVLSVLAGCGVLSTPDADPSASTPPAATSPTTTPTPSPTGSDENETSAAAGNDAPTAQATRSASSSTSNQQSRSTAPAATATQATASSGNGSFGVGIGEGVRTWSATAGGGTTAVVSVRNGSRVCFTYAEYEGVGFVGDLVATETGQLLDGSNFGYEETPAIYTVTADGGSLTITHTGPGEVYSSYWSSVSKATALELIAQHIPTGDAPSIYQQLIDSTSSLCG